MNIICYKSMAYVTSSLLWDLGTVETSGHPEVQRLFAKRKRLHRLQNCEGSVGVQFRERWEWTELTASDCTYYKKKKTWICISNWSKQAWTGHGEQEQCHIKLCLWFRWVNNMWLKRLKKNLSRYAKQRKIMAWKTSLKWEYMQNILFTYIFSHVYSFVQN